jgi:hypothetical protein
MTMADIEEQIEQVETRLEGLTEQYERDEEAAAEAEADYRIAHAQVFLLIRANGVQRADGSVAKASEKEADAHATVRCADDLRAYKITSGKMRATKQAVEFNFRRLDTLRTRAANARGQS